MRIAVSDYDGTIRVNGATRGEVAEAVREWRRAGNAFGIATGRDLSMTDFEIRRMGLEFDFLVCMNGGAVYDGEKNLLEYNRIDDALIPRILKHEAAERSMHCVLLGKGETLLYDPHDSWYARNELPNRKVGREEALAATDLAEISFGFAEPGQTQIWARALERDFGDGIAAQANIRVLDINRKGVDKAAGIARVLEIKGWSEYPVYVVGDGGNDVGMVAGYRGCCVPNAIDAVKSVAKQEFSDVGTMLRCIMEER